MKNFKKITNILLIILILLAFSANYTFALEGMSGIYKQESGMDKLLKIGGSAFRIAQAVGMAVAMIGLVVIALKYMYSSPNEKAGLKSKAFPYLIGCFILFGVSALLGLIQTFSNNFLNK